MRDCWQMGDDVTLGAQVATGGTYFSVRSGTADALTLCLFHGADEKQVPMARKGDVWSAFVSGVSAGQHYGYRADGPWHPEQGDWFDPAKLLIDPYAVALDRRYEYDPRLSTFGADTAALVPKAIVQTTLLVPSHKPPRFQRGGLIYEINVRGFTMLHPDVPPELRGTIAALAHPAVIAHLQKLHVTAIELMPITAWIDERHLPPLGLTNAWGYNPVALMALDPRLAPGGIAELRETVAALHQAGIGVILDLVFNHTGESDRAGPILSLRGLDNRCYYAHAPDGSLINDTGCGNTLNASHPVVRALILDTLRHFVRTCGIDGFRFDLAPIIARAPGFDRHAPIFNDIASDPALADRVMIAEPWDIGPGGYQLGNFPPNWLEWNDRFRDDVRRFWRGDGTLGSLVTRIAGSSDVFGAHCRSVNFLAAHDGFTLADTVAYQDRHNLANGEDNRDGHGENYSWNNGVEGATEDVNINARRRADIKAMLETLFASTGTLMLTAGDEFGRSQQGNNNAYAQDNSISWIDWATRDLELEAFCASLAAFRAHNCADFISFPENGIWHRLDGGVMTTEDWDAPEPKGCLFISAETEPPYALRIDRNAHAVRVTHGPHSRQVTRTIR